VPHDLRSNAADPTAGSTNHPGSLELWFSGENAYRTGREPHAKLRLARLTADEDTSPIRIGRRYLTRQLELIELSREHTAHEEAAVGIARSPDSEGTAKTINPSVMLAEALDARGRVAEALDPLPCNAAATQANPVAIVAPYQRNCIIPDHDPGGGNRSVLGSEDHRIAIGPYCAARAYERHSASGNGPKGTCKHGTSRS
jgi:hypothetical protein